MYMEANIEFSFSITQQIWRIMFSSFIFGDSKAPGNYPRKILRISSYKMLLKSNYIARHLHCVKHALQCTVLWQIYGKHLVPGSGCPGGRAGPGFYYLSLSLPSLLDLKFSSIFDADTHTRIHISFCICCQPPPHSPPPPPAIWSSSPGWRADGI